MASGSAQARTNPRRQSQLGSKTITYWGGVVLNINNIMGPAMVALPYLNQSSGWFMCTVILIICCILSAFASTMLCDAMQRIPGNRAFTALSETGQRFEFCDVIKHYYGRRAAFVGQIFFNTSLQASNIAAMVICAQILDDFFVFVCKWCVAIQYDVWPPRWITDHAMDQGASLWPSPFCLSIGFVVALVICIPFGLLNLDDNMWFQWLAFVCLMIFFIEFLVQFAVLGNQQDHHCPEDCPGLDLTRTPAFTDNQAKVVGVIAFSYAFVVTIPSWVNEKVTGVNVNEVVWGSCVAGLLMKLFTGIFGAWAYNLVKTGSHFPAVDDLSNAQNILLVLDHKEQPMITQYSAYLFTITTLIPGIPVLAIVIKYNLVTSGLCSPSSATFLAVVAPWIVTAFLYNTSFFVDVLNWAALLAMGFINFVVPPILYLKALQRYPYQHEKEDDGAGSIEGGEGEEPAKESDMIQRQSMLDLPTAASSGALQGAASNGSLQGAASNGLGQPLLDNTTVLPTTHAPSVPALLQTRSKLSESIEAPSAKADHAHIEALVNAVPSYVARWVSRELVAKITIMAMCFLVVGTIFINLFFLVVLHKDLVDS